MIRESLSARKDRNGVQECEGNGPAEADATFRIGAMSCRFMIAKAFIPKNVANPSRSWKSIPESGPYFPGEVVVILVL